MGHRRILSQAPRVSLKEVVWRMRILEAGVQLGWLQDGRQLFSVVLVEVHIGTQVDLQGEVESGD
eukprot:4463432-Pyramimonas_sp.AAC.1